MKRVLLVLALTTLAACQSTTNAPPVNMSPLPITVNPGTTILEGRVYGARLDGTPVPMKIDGVSLVGLVNNSALGKFDRLNFKGYFSAASQNGTATVASVNSVAFYGVPTSRSAVVSYAANGLNDTSAATYSRVGTTVLPTSGSAFIAGVFRGSYKNSTGLNTIGGDVGLDLDFGTAQISGWIKDVTTLNATTGMAASSGRNHFTLLPAAIAPDGSFSGGAISSGFIGSGGQSITNTTGGFEGLITGANGSDAAGYISIVETYSSGLVVPYSGVFTAE